MLQIILFILKLIGWMLLLILGLLVLILVAALFTPLRYQMETSCKGKLSTLEAGVNFRILFRLVNGNLRYRDGKLSWKIRVAWIRLGSQAEVEDLEEHTEEKIEGAVTAVAEAEEEKPEHIEEQAEEAVEKKPEKAAVIEEKAKKQKPKKAAATGEKKAKEQKSENATNAREDNAEKVSENPADTIEEKTKESIADKIVRILEKIKYTFDKICDKIRMLLEKAEIVKAFLTDDVHQSAFLKCLTELKKMVIRMRPKCIGGEVHFGFEDPSLTGRLLAGASMLYPYWGEHVRCCPDFENKILEGEVSVKGSLRLFPAAIFIWNLLWNKNVRRTIMDAKRFLFK